MRGISTHILDTARGRPAPGVSVSLDRRRSGEWTGLASAETDADGRIHFPLAPEAITPGAYRLTFLTAPYFAAQNLRTLYPEITVAFTILEGERNFHIPLLLTAHSYTTYRGS